MIFLMHAKFRDGSTPMHAPLSYSERVGPHSTKFQNIEFRLSNPIPNPCCALVFDFVGASQCRILSLSFHSYLGTMAPK